jgi:hypothetical protein
MLGLELIKVKAKKALLIIIPTDQLKVKLAGVASSDR